MSKRLFKLLSLLFMFLLFNGSLLLFSSLKISEGMSNLEPTTNATSQTTPEHYPQNNKLLKNLVVLLIITNLSAFILYVLGQYLESVIM